MSTKKKLLEAAAGNAGGAVYVDDVFSTYLYEGNGSTQTITNGIDLDGEGGMVWIKGRNAASNHALVNTERGGSNSLASDTTAAERTDGAYGVTFNSNGFDSTGGNLNVSGREQVSWTFRKQPGFFDVVTYTGDGTSNGSLKVPHNLGSAPGAIFIKRADGTNDWFVTHRSTKGELYLNTTDAVQYSGTDRVTLGATELTFNTSSPTVNFSGATYVAYLFAHNDGDGEFGEDADQDIIKCGSYTGAGTVDLGFEPQWVLYKRTDSTGPWYLNDTMRGFPVDGNQAFLYANTSDAESSGGGLINPTSTGFTHINAGTYIYIAIRRGPMKTPESGTEVFAIDTRQSTEPAYVSGFPVDMAIRKLTTGSGSLLSSRLNSGAYLRADLTDAESSSATYAFDYQSGYNSLTATSSIDYSWMFRRAPGFFDVVAYTGDGQTTQTLNHNLGVTPELMIGKRRNDTQNWVVYHSLVGAGKYYNLNTTSGASTLSTVWGGAAPTSTQFTVGNSTTVNFNGDSYISYHFATLAGVSKVGSYTGTGSNVNVDCGFSAGARFILIKRSDSSGDWYVWDSERGIVAGNDPYLLLNSTAAEVTSTDYIDPLSSGFTVTSSAPAALNASGGTYIFLAIA